RFCVNFTEFNNKTYKINYPIPQIDEILDKLGSAKYFSNLDLLSAYWQIPVEEGSKKFTSFTTMSGQYEFNRMPFGLSNAVGHFQRIVNAVFEKGKFTNVLVYLDDIILFSEDFETHMKQLEEVLLQLQKYNFTLKLSKCSFLRQE